MSITDPKFLMVDLFCGAGGTSLGAELSGVCKVIAAVNHDPLAIASHQANHQGVYHFVEDVRKLPLDVLKAIVDKARAEYSHAKLILWASLECTNHSNAKGGLPRDADSRTLAEVLPSYIDALGDVDFIMIENVREFLAWGPLDGKGKPISRKNGQDYIRWVKSIESRGYKWDYKLLNSADYGAAQSRVRLFGAFHRLKQMPFPEATHVRRKKNVAMFEDCRKPWQPVYPVLDFSNLGNSIFTRKKDLVDNTLKRIMRGLEKYQDEILLMTCNTPGYCRPVTEPSGALTTAGHKALVIPMVMTNYTPGTTRGIDEPAQTVTAGSNLHMVTAVIPFLQSYYGAGGSFQATDQPAPTLTTTDRLALISPFIDRQFGNGAPQSIHQPSGTLTTNPKSNLITPFLVNPQFHNSGNSVLKPSPTIIASQRSRPLSLAVAEYTNTSIEDKPRDTETMRALKVLARQLGISDIYFRMLTVTELKCIQGFPEDYILQGNDEDKKKFIGNAVVPQVVEVWLKALHKWLLEH